MYLPYGCILTSLNGWMIQGICRKRHTGCFTILLTTFSCLDIQYRNIFVSLIFPKTTYSHFSNRRFHHLHYSSSLNCKLKYCNEYSKSIISHRENLMEFSFQTWKSPQSGLWSHITTSNKASHTSTVIHLHPSLQLPVLAPSPALVPFLYYSWWTDVQITSLAYGGTSGRAAGQKVPGSRQLSDSSNASQVTSLCMRMTTKETGLTHQ